MRSVLFPRPYLQLVLSVGFIDIDLSLKLSVQIPEQGEQSLHQLKSTSPISEAGGAVSGAGLIKIICTVSKTCSQAKHWLSNLIKVSSVKGKPKSK